MKQERKYGLDIVRIIATLSVLSVHFFLKTNYYNTPLNSMPMRVQSIIRNFFMICVPLFLLSTGYLMKDKSLNKKYYFGIIDARDAYKIINIKATVKWNNDDENNVADTESGVENSIIVLPLTVRVEQMN